MGEAIALLAARVARGARTGGPGLLAGIGDETAWDFDQLVRQDSE